MSIRFENKSVIIDDVPTFIYSGEFAYYRVPQEVWADRLARLKAGGLNCVGLYFAWNYHSPSAGEYDFTSYGKDITALLQIVRDLGLYVTARPGPYICNEWDLGGYPSWLLTEDSGDWRSADPKHLRYLREWYRAVNAIIGEYQHDNGGTVVLYQIENEYRWSDNELLDALYDYAREDGITVPLIGNHDGGAISSGAKVTDGIDTYTDVGERYRWRGWAQGMYHRIGPDTPLMVLEFRGCDMSLWGDPAPSEERLPADWIVAQEKLFIATGANLTNRFIAAGGLTPRNFYSDHITTEYGTRAAVAPWGAVTDTNSFAFMRLWGEFVGSVNPQLAVSKPWNIGWGTDNPQVECLARKGPDGLFFTLSNISRKTQTARITTSESLPISELPITLDSGEIRVVVANLRVAGLRIAYCTVEILKIASLNGQPYVVLFGHAGTKAKIGFEQEGRVREFTVDLLDGPTLETTIIEGQLVNIYGVSINAAVKTWFLPTTKGIAPLFTNANLLMDSRGIGSAVVETPAQFELRIVAPPLIGALSASGTEAVRLELEDGMTEWCAQLPRLAAPAVEVGPLQIRRESDWTAAMPAEHSGWRTSSAYGADRETILRPGHLRWITEFDNDSNSDTIELLGVSTAEIEAYLNGIPIGIFPQVRPPGYPFMSRFGASFDVTDSIRPGKNVLAVSMNIPGRHNCGQPIYCGFSAPVILRPEQREEVPLPIWYASPPDDRRWLCGELSGSPEPAQYGYDRSGWQSIDLTEPESQMWMLKGDERHQVRWYHATVRVPQSLSGRPLFLETAPVEEAWVYVNGDCIGRKLSGTSSVHDLTEYSGEAEFEVTIAVRHNWYFFVQYWGLSSAPSLLSANQVIGKQWLLSNGTEGEHGAWAVSDEGWTAAEDEAGERDLWLRRSVEIESWEGIIAPLYVEMSGWSRHADIYWNGVSIGLYASEGPQTRFYVPDGLVSSQNQLAVHVTGYGAPVIIGNLDVKTYGPRRLTPISASMMAASRSAPL